MTEQEWMECNNPQKMLAYLRWKASDRKLTLFKTAIGRHIWHLLEDETCRHAIVSAERFAEGLITREELREAIPPRTSNYAGTIAFLSREAAVYVACLGRENNPEVDACRYAQVASQAVAGTLVGEVCWATRCSPAMAVEYARHASLVRDIFGPLPFRRATIDPAWLSPSVTQLAQTIYEERAFHHLPIFADLLQESGCTDADILNHCRQSSEHVRGCWCLDLIIGKE